MAPSATAIHSTQIYGNCFRGFPADASAGKCAGVTFHHRVALAASNAASPPNTVTRVAIPAATSAKYRTDASPGPNRQPSDISTNVVAQRGPAYRSAVRARATNHPLPSKIVNATSQSIYGLRRNKITPWPKSAIVA